MILAGTKGKYQGYDCVAGTKGKYQGYDCVVTSHTDNGNSQLLQFEAKVGFGWGNEHSDIKHLDLDPSKRYWWISLYDTEFIAEPKHKIAIGQRYLYNTGSSAFIAEVVKVIDDSTASIRLLQNVKGWKYDCENHAIFNYEWVGNPKTYSYLIGQDAPSVS